MVNSDCKLANISLFLFLILFYYVLFYSAHNICATLREGPTDNVLPGPLIKMSVAEKYIIRDTTVIPVNKTF